ncbi:MAG: antibiotic biosynthesis monooxygenase [Calditrichaeota bacterium]|nr:antibiotic biosynthesis monooxygenase [Calditrichota bacterium]
MRFLHLKIDPEFIKLLFPFHSRIVIPALQKAEGCLFAGLIQNNHSTSECIAITLWQTKKQAESYEKSDAYGKLMEQVKPYLSESMEWKIQLSENLELQYQSEKEEPVSREFIVTAQKAMDDELKDRFTPFYVRLVSVKCQPDRVDDFLQIYSTEIVPVLNSMPGCRYIYLSENLHQENEIISITVWDSKEDADRYEKSGLFRDLIKKVEHTFSRFYQWKMDLENNMKGKIKTSEDLQVNSYELVSGKRFM